MKFFYPVGGVTDERFAGVYTSPDHRGVPAGVANGLPWAAELGCLDGPNYVRRFVQSETRPWLVAMQEWKFTCVFITVPDVVSDAQATLDAFKKWHPRFADWPCAFVAQDGQEHLEFPDDEDWSCLFVGGTTRWKVSDAAVSVIKRAQDLGKHIHIGRVNWWKRYKFFRGIEGSKEFTCDGTRQRFDGAERTLTAWADYQEREYQMRLPLPVSHHPG